MTEITLFKRILMNGDDFVFTNYRTASFFYEGWQALLLSDLGQNSHPKHIQVFLLRFILIYMPLKFKSSKINRKNKRELTEKEV